MSSTEKGATDRTIALLSAVAMVLVLAMHRSNTGFAPLCKWLAFGSYVVPIFFFISGYLCKYTPAESNPKTFLAKKAKSLLIPYLGVSLFYGIVCTLLRHTGVINYGTDLSLYSFFVLNFTSSQQYVFNLPTWYVITLLFIECLFIPIAETASRIKGYPWPVILMLSIAFGIIARYAAVSYETPLWLRALLKVIFFMPFFLFGYIYKRKIKEYDKLSAGAWILVLLVMVYAMKSISGYNYSYAPASLSFHAGQMCWIPYAAGFIGIFFWYKACSLLSPLLGSGRVWRLTEFFGRNTWDVMSHHVFVYFLFNLSFLNLGLAGFDEAAFRESIWYVYIPYSNNFVYVIYITAVVLPLFLRYLYNKMVAARTEKINK